jgi:DNA polymerase I
MIYAVGPLSVGSAFDRVTLQDVVDYFKNHKHIELDTETTSLNPHDADLICIQLGDPENQYVIDARYTNLNVIFDLLSDKLCVLHNAKFDYKILRKQGFLLENIYDIFLAEGVIFNGYEEHDLSLAGMAKRYVNVELDKQPRNEFAKIKDGEPLTDGQIYYASQDVAHLTNIAKIQRRLVKKYQCEYAVKLENQACKALADIEYNGMYLDKEDWLKLATANEKKLLSVEHDLDQLVIKQNIGFKKSGAQDLFGAELRQLSVNYNSPPQVLNILRLFGLPINDTREKTLLKHRNVPIVEKILEYRETVTKVNRYGKNFIRFIHPKTKRIHTDFWQIKNTYRLGSGNVKKNYPNVQNIPSEKEYRNCFKPRPGYKWLSIDYSQQELRLMADFSNERGMIKVLNSGEDLHCYVATEIFGKPVQKGSPERDKIKPVNFGKPYGMSPIALAEALFISEKEAADIFRTYARKFPRLERWLIDRANFGKTRGYILVHPDHGGRRWFPDIEIARELRQKAYPDWSQVYGIEGSIERESMNTPIQGTGAVIMKEALIQAREIIKRYDAYLICTVHDQLDVEVRDSQAETLCDELEQAMIQVGNKYVKHVNMEVDSKILDKWQK